MATWHFRIGRRVSPTAAGTSDDALLAGLRAGDCDAFERLYADYAGSIYNVSLRILRSPEDAEDVTQEVFIKAYKRLPGCENDLRLKAWLNRVAVNACYDHLRSRGSHADLDAMSGMASLRRIDALEQAELAQVLEKALDSLSLEQRTVLLLKDLQGLTQEEIAGVLGVSESATESRLFRARAAFRRAYSELTQPWQRAHCDLARQAAIDSVGRGLSARQRRRILRHAETCPDCGEAVRSWGVAAAGLAVLLPALPLPAGLVASPFGALGVGAAGGGLAAAGVTGVGAAGAGAGGAATGTAATIVGGLAAKAAIVVIVAGALTASAGLAAHHLTAPRAHGRVAASAAGSREAKSPGAALVADDSSPGSGHRPPTAARGAHAHHAKAARGVARNGGKAPDKASRGKGRHAPTKAVPSAAAAARGKSGSRGHANASGDNHPHGSSGGTQGHQGKTSSVHSHGKQPEHP